MGMLLGLTEGQAVQIGDRITVKLTDLRPKARKIQLWIEAPRDEIISRVDAHVEQVFRTRTLAEVEREHLMRVLFGCRGNKIAAASLLGMTVETLSNKLERYADDGQDRGRVG